MEQGFEYIEELYENISRGGEVEFEYGGRKYSITHSNKGIHVMEFYNYSSETVYELPEEVGEYNLIDKKLKDVITDLVIHFRCL